MHMDSFSPASPPSFSFPRIARRRRRSTTTGGPPAPPTPNPVPPPPEANTILGINMHNSGLVAPAASNALPGTSPINAQTAQNGSNLQSRMHRIRLVPHLENARSLHFDPIIRDVKFGGTPLRVGRFTDRQTNPTRGNGLNPNDRNSDKVAFRSKVVSRSHAELWVENTGQFYLKDTKSSSGTFVNHMRLSPPGQESLAHLLKDGDIIQLGVDYQGGTEEMYRCVKIKVEVGQGREWQGGANAFNTAALKQLKTLQARDDDKGKGPLKKSVGDCCICLFAVTVCQSLFIAPCSHAFHYKCIRPLLELHHPGFSCPLCRTFADLEADVEVDAEELEHWDELVEESKSSAENGKAVSEPPTSGLGVFPVPSIPRPNTEDAIQVDSEPDANNAPRRRFFMPSFGFGHSTHDNADPNATANRGRRQTFVNGPNESAPRRGQSAIEDDAQVENALVVDYESDSGANRVDEHGAMMPGTFAANTVNGTRRPAGETMPMDETLAHAGGAGFGRTAGSTRGAPVPIQTNRRPSPDGSDQEARDFAEATTPLNNTFIAMAQSLLGTVQQDPAGSQAPPVPPLPSTAQSSSFRGQNHRNPFLDADDQDVELELDDGTEAEENGRASSSGSGTGSNGHGLEASGLSGDGGVALATSSPRAGVAGAKRKR